MLTFLWLAAMLMGAIAVYFGWKNDTLTNEVAALETVNAFQAQRIKELSDARLDLNSGLREVRSQLAAARGTIAAQRTSIALFDRDGDGKPGGSLPNAKTAHELGDRDFSGSR